MKHRRSIRLQHYDYAQAGAYFVTICTQHRACVLGEVVDGQMQLSALGQIVADGWLWLAQQYAHVQLDEWVVMPNHVHGIILLTDEARVDGDKGGSRTAPTNPHNVPRKPLGQLVGAFKTVTTKRVNALRETPAAVFWQRDFHEHVIRNEADLARLQTYVANNPLQWMLDSLHPCNLNGNDVAR
jgi:putative transposase